MKTWTDRYCTAFGIAVALVLLAPALDEVLAGLTRQVDPSRMGAGVALAALAYAGYLVLARTFGPVAVSAADAAWLLLSPLPRRGVLRKTVGILLAVALLTGLALGVGLLSALGAPDPFMVRLLTAGVLGISATTGGMAVAVLAQASQSWDTWLLAMIIAVVVLAVLAAVLGGGPWRPLLSAVAGAPACVGSAVAVVAATATAVLVRLAWAALERVPARSILAASTRTGQVVTATVLLDPGTLTWIAEDEHWRRRRLRSRPLPRRLPAPLAPAWPDWRRAARRPGRSALLLASAALPALAARAGGGLTPVVLTVLAAGALITAAACTAGVRRDRNDPSLARLSGIGARPALAARALLPALAGGGWLALALTGLVATGALSAGPWWLFGLVAAPALAVGALRMARRGPVDHSLPPIPTPFGVMFTGPVLWALTGADLAALGCAPALMALGAQPPDLGSYLLAQALTGTGVAAVFLLRRRSH
ncbi:hypothetical protein SAMN04489712_106139 [Thermomonospora echinospora]|uniref:ABC-2 type transport system permease protein n=1 Tax=Thermomonospora echinospora TaxID=1992 RepID=A0A1H6B0M7_9ACTN|nr:DUF6297 family protein [Thermomonospora echinospora]SEG54150.1 hypothetical protein SAMN04489712_106139 [Thermomonospora echinospora]